MKKLLILPLFILSFTAFGQFTKPQLYNGINTNIRHKTASQKRLADMLDSLVVSMGTGGGGTYTSSNGITLTGSNFTLGGTLEEYTELIFDDIVNSGLYIQKPDYGDGFESSFLLQKNATYNNIQMVSGRNVGQKYSEIDLGTYGNNALNRSGINLKTNGGNFIIYTGLTSGSQPTERMKIDSVGNVSFDNNTSFTINGNAIGTNTEVVLTDAATIDLTATKHTLATSAATRTFTITYTGDDITIEVTLSNTAATYTFPVGSLCISEGVASGDNTVGLAGVSGDKYIIGVKKIGSVYYVAVKNFGQ